MVTRRAICTLLTLSALASLPTLFACGAAVARAQDQFAQPDITTVNPANHCTLASLKGAYGGHSEGTIVAQLPGLPPPPFPWAGVALHEYDGAGNVRITYALSLGGNPVPWGTTAIGTYTITGNCLVSVTISEDPLMGPWHFQGQILGWGMFQKAHFMYTDPYMVGFGAIERTPVGGCSRRLLRGTYAIVGQGTDVSVPLPGFSPPFPMGHLATLTVDGAGNITGEGEEDTAGFAFPATYTGTYTVNPDCIVSFAISDTALGTTMTIPMQGVITGEGEFQQIHTIVTVPGQVFSDTGTKE
ncbi:MAG TPA: hypothetical protein VMT38_02685 [Terracidiphilus sp.]|nr:hypothetical protein [Terracidiphilus sp.]